MRVCRRFMRSDATNDVWAFCFVLQSRLPLWVTLLCASDKLTADTCHAWKEEEEDKVLNGVNLTQPTKWDEAIDRRPWESNNLEDLDLCAVFDVSKELFFRKGRGQRKKRHNYRVDSLIISNHGDTPFV
ncbi:hypothetical protein VNO77_24040 [Canavalia gladiata]|uniref:Uncharacterized protein n=1 Tax=Canavalia gladiata TaxID=3824 RepID=A0AAN9L8X4_CANGL